VILTSNSLSISQYYKLDVLLSCLVSYLSACFNIKNYLVSFKIINVAFARVTHKTKLVYNKCFMPLKIVKVKINSESHNFNS